MIGIDTNILLRLVLEDDEEQVTIARSAMVKAASEGRLCFINHIVLVEFVWVLESGFRKSRADIAFTLQTILDSEGFIVENREAVEKALLYFKEGAYDFPDALIAVDNRSQGCSTTLTFDRKAARLPEFQLPA